MELLKNKNQLIFLFLILIETLLISIFRGFFGYYISPLVLFIVSLSIVFHPFYLLKKKEISFATNHSKNISFVQKIILWSIFIILSIGTFIKIYLYFETYPIDLLSSDIIPTFQKMAYLFINGEYPYSTFDDFGYILKPSYLTLHWIPFVLPEYFNIDPRWMGMISLYIGVFLLFNYQIKSNSKFVEKVLLLIIPFLFFFFLVKYSDILRLTVETLIIGYYLILGMILISKSENVWILTVGILLCLLSRFSLVIWLPTLFVVYYVNNKKNLVLLLISIITGVLLLYVIPFLSVDFSTISNHFGKAIDEWYPKEWSIDNKPKEIFNGVGFASYFYSILSYTIPIKAKITQYFHIFISLLTGVCCAFYYTKINLRINKQLYLILSLKLCLVVFYNFIHVPYAYLSMVHVYFSLVILISIDWNKPILSK